MKTILCYLLLSFLSFSLYAQQTSEERCAYHPALEEWIKERPEAAREAASWNDKIATLVATTQPRAGEILRIPVVFHIIHSNESIGVGSNVSMERIQSQLDILNDDYRRLNSDASSTPGGYAAYAGDAEIEFCLATTNQFGQATDGITRNYYPNIPSVSYIENTIKAMTSWDSRRFLNIWTVEMPSSSVIGYAFLPLASILGTHKDGVVINYNNFGYINSSNRGRTLTHEVGHYLGLKHIWGDNTSNGTPIGCSSDDGVSDTPNQSGPYYFCPGGERSSCSSSDMYMNFMDYTDDYCMNLFTIGQADVMRSTLETFRSALLDQGEINCPADVACEDLRTNDYRMGFESNEDSNGWLAEDVNNDGNSWDFYTGTNNDWGPNAGDGFAAYLWNQDRVTPADDYLFTPCFEVESGHTYRLEFSTACASDENNVVYPERLEVGLSANQQSSDFYSPASWSFDPVSNPYPNYQNHTISFDAQENGTLSIGFHVFSAADQYVLQIDDIRISDEGLIAGTSDIEEGGNFRLFPNPIRNQLTVALDLAEAYDDAIVEIYDVLGRLVDHRILEARRSQQLYFDFTNKKTGIYFVSLKAAGTISTQKVLYSGS